MNSDEKDVVKMGMEVALRPITAVAEDAIGILGGDWLSEKRRRNREKLRQKTEAEMKARGADVDDDPSPSVVTPLLAAAQDESRDELIEIFAALLSTAMDPATRAIYRRDFVEIAKGLEPLDALVLERLNTNQPLLPSRAQAIANDMGLSPDLVELSFGNLQRMQLAGTHQRLSGKFNPQLTSLGRVFLKAVKPGTEVRAPEPPSKPFFDVTKIA